MDLAMPALPSEVDIRADLQDVCFVPDFRRWLLRTTPATKAIIYGMSNKCHARFLLLVTTDVRNTTPDRRLALR